MGIEDPKSSTCCPLECGTCGGSDCSAKPRGATSCCPDAIPIDKICGNFNERAPCHLEYPDMKGIPITDASFYPLNYAHNAKFGE